MKANGFSLLEMLIVVFIVSMLATITVVNFRQGQNQDALRFGIDLLKTDLRKIETDAMSGVTVNGEFPDGGYGIFMEKDADIFTIFGDDGGDLDYDYELGEEIPNGVVELPLNVTISDLYVDGSVSDAIVRILPPSPTRYVDNVENKTLTILLEHRDLDECRVLTYNSSTAFITDDINPNCELP